MKKQVQHFSGGMKKRLSLAIALLHEPEILILDEPTVGIDPLLRKTIWAKFYDLKKKGTTIIVTTHIMDEAEFCERLGLIREGKLVATGTTEELKSGYHQEGLKMSFCWKRWLNHESYRCNHSYYSPIFSR